MSQALEESSTEMFQRQALEEVREQFPRHFDTVNMHPRQLIGAEVPSISGEGMETLRSSEDARDWQEAMKALLVQEIRGRAEKMADEDRTTIQTVHASIELFQNNSDLVPGTKQFDKELADQLVRVAKPYEVRVDGKLYGFNIPLQPLIEQLRAQLKEDRAKKAAVAETPPAAEAPKASAPAAPAAASAAPAAPAAGVKPAPAAPQAGIPSQAGQSTEGENFDDLFGTLGLRGLRI